MKIILYTYSKYSFGPSTGQVLHTSYLIPLCPSSPPAGHHIPCEEFG